MASSLSLRAGAFVAALAALIAGTTLARAAEPMTRVVDVPTRDATQRFLYVRPPGAVANLVFLPGLAGVMGIADDGSMPTVAGRCAPLARTRDAFALRRMAVALVDKTSDGKVRQVADVREVVRYMRARDDVPTWIVGGSASTLAALTFAASVPASELHGVVIFSPMSGVGADDFARAGRVERPVLVIYHRDDKDTLPYVAPLYAALSSAPAKERVALAGGSSEGCGHHLFAGLDAEFVAAVTDFIVRQSRFTR